MTNETLLLVAGALAVGAFIPRLMSRMDWKVPKILMPETPAGGEAAGVTGEPVAAPEYKATASSRRPLVEMYDWFVRAGAGLIEPTAGDLRLCAAIKPHLDGLVAAKPATPNAGPSLSSLNLK